MNWWLSTTWERCAERSIRGRSRLPRSRCAGLQISAPSGSRSGASAHSRRGNAGSSPGLESARCSQERCEPDVRFDCRDAVHGMKTKANSASDDFARAERAAKFILSKTKLRPRIGLVLGSGLGAFADEFSDAARIAYEKIPL